MIHLDQKGRVIDDQWWLDRAEEIKKEYRDHYLPAKRKAKGWCFRNGKYEANIKFFGTTRHLGRFDTPEEARRVYLEAVADFEENFDDYWQERWDTK